MWGVCGVRHHVWGMCGVRHHVLGVCVCGMCGIGSSDHVVHHRYILCHYLIKRILNFHHDNLLSRHLGSP